MKLVVIILFSILSSAVFADEQKCMQTCELYKDQCVQNSINAIEEDSSYCTQQLSECYLACKNE